LEYSVITMNTKLVSLRVPEGLIEEARKIAAVEQRSRAQILVRWISAGCGMELSKAAVRENFEWGQREDARIVAEHGLVAIEIPVPIEAAQYVRNLQMVQHREMIIEDNAKQVAGAFAKMTNGAGAKKIASEKPLADVEAKRERALSALGAVGLSSTPENAEEAAPVKLCVACECNLVTVKGKWVCDHQDCGMYGAEQKGKRLV
jgi:hypothetical protein